MSTDKVYNSTAAAARDFFGDHPDPSIKFIPEWKALSPADKDEIKAGLQKIGYTIEDRASI